MATEDIVVVGLGEVGRPLFELVREKHHAIGVDIAPVTTDGVCGILHICYPFNDRFVESTVKYIEQYGPNLTIINSTVAPGTTRAVHCATGSALAYSPIRGKHVRMKHDMLHYTKFVGGIDRQSAISAAEHYVSLGMKTKLLSSPEAAELAKLTETTYFGVLIAWAQEVERYCDRLQVEYTQVASFYDEIPFFPPVRYSPGVIGGHCVMPNIEILKRIFESDLLDAIVRSNDVKKDTELLACRGAES